MYLLLVSAVVLLVLDAIVLTLLSSFFAAQIQDVQRSPVRLNFLGAALCYACLIAGLYYFILKPRRPVADAFVLGLIIYGVYEGTNLAILEKWRVSTVVIDTLWGGTLFALTTYITRQLV